MSNLAKAKAFAGQICSLRFLFDRIWLKELFARRDAAFRLSVKQYSDLYCAAYFMATTYKKGQRLEQQDAILKFALDLNEELTLRYSTDKNSVKMALEHIFMFLDRFHLRRMQLPRMAEHIAEQLCVNN